MSHNASRLPARPSLEQLQKQAKELLKQYRSGAPTALQRFHVVSARFTDPTRQPSLADAQFVLAREYGFEDWAKLKEQINLMRASVPQFISAKKPFYTIDWQQNAISVPAPQTDADWDLVFNVMRQHRITALTARGMTDAALDLLTTLDAVTQLRITESPRVTDHGIRHLARMPQLRTLELGGRNSPVTDAGLEVLHHLPELRKFQACWTPALSDVGVAGLTKSDRLEDVNLLGTHTGDGVIRALTGKRHLRRFQTGRLVTDTGLSLLQHFPVFKTWQGGDLKYGLMSADADPNFLLIDGPFTDRGLALLAALDGLFALTLFWHCPAFTSSGLAPLQNLPNLGFLGCQDDHCDDQAMRHIASFPRLRMLMGQGAVATDAGFEALSRSPTIEYLWGRDCPNLTGRGFAALANMPSLRGLAVSCKNVDDASLSRFADFPALRELLPMDVNDAGFRHVTHCENLEALWCMYCRDTGDAATSHLAGMTQLKKYYAGKTKITDHSLEILGRMESLESLEFWQCAGLTTQGMSHLARLPQLREITLEGLPNVARQAVSVFPAQVRVRYAE